MLINKKIYQALYVKTSAEQTRLQKKFEHFNTRLVSVQKKLLLIDSSSFSLKLGIWLFLSCYDLNFFIADNFVKIRTWEPILISAKRSVSTEINNQFKAMIPDAQHKRTLQVYDSIIAQGLEDLEIENKKL